MKRHIHMSNNEHVSAYRLLILASVSALALGAGPALAQSPEGGVVAKGKASITQKAGRSTIRQTTKRAVIDWQGFDVGRDHTVVFDQPGKSSATLNRVNSVKGSVIEGAIRAPGTVVIQNTAGVIFTGKAKVDVGGLVATSQIVGADAFQRNGRLEIGGGEQAGARIVNRGEITIGDTGLAALVGRDVENAGAIIANRGTVALASGTRSTIDLTGDGMIQIAVSGDAEGGRVTNSGRIDAAGGKVILTAGGAAGALDSVINTSGVIRASSADGAGGDVTIEARGKGTVSVSGRIESRGGADGGTLDVTGQRIAVGSAARIDVSGATDGGRVRIGGDVKGSGPLRRAEHLDIATGSRIAADGGSGTGGTIVAWSDGATTFDGTISATGGYSGGFVETSGKFDLGIGANASVSLGGGGQWLLDPRNVSIVRPDGTNVSGGTTNPPNGSGPYTVNADSIEAALNGGSDVTITTEQERRDDLGDILVLSPLNWTGTGALRLIADEDVTISQSITTQRGDFFAIADDDVEIEAPVTSTGSADLVFQTLGITPFAGSQIRIYDNVVASGTGSVTVDAQKGPVRFLGNASSNLIMRTQSGDLSISAGSADRPSDQWDFGVVIAERESDQSGSNIQIYSGSGSVDISADTSIDLNGGNGRSGKWVRVGRTDSSSDVTLTAPKINITGGDKTNNFAEAVAGARGSLSMRADAITLQNNAGFARALAQSGAGLSMLAETQTWNGRVEAGTDPVTGGETEISGAITATVQPRFSLTEDRNFVMKSTSPLGKPSSYQSNLPLAVETSGSGTIDIGGPVTARQITLLSDARVGIGADAQVTGTGPDDAVVISAGAQFRNEAGPDSVQASDPAARWLVYIDEFSGLDGDAVGPREYDLYNRLYEFNLPDSLADFTGNRIVYGQQPVITLTGETLSKPYGTAATPGFTLTGLRPGDDRGTAFDTLPSVSSAGSAAAAPVAGGPYSVDVAATASSQGYALEFVPGVLTVTPVDLRVTADNADRTYGAANPAFTASFEGFVLDEDAGSLGGTLAFETDAVETSPVGDYDLTASGLVSSNYTITYAPGTLSIDPAALRITANDAARTYGGTDPTFTASYEGLVAGDAPGDLTGALAFDTDAVAASPVGTYRLSASGQTSANYDITYVDGSFEIDPAALLVTANDAARTYGSGNPDLTATITGFVLDDDAGILDGTLSVTTDATNSSDVGAYAITAGGLGTTNQNYAITYVDGTLSVDPAALTVSVNDADRSYGSANPAFTASYDGFVLGQDADVLDGTLAFTTDATRRSDVGTYAVTAGGQSSGNYAISYVGGSLEIDPAALTVSVNDADRSYGSANPAFTASYDGFVLGQDADVLDGTLAFTTDATRRSDVGTYAVTAGGQSSGNYAISYVGGSLEIDPAALTVSVNDADRSYGSANPAFTASYDGFVLGQDADVLDGTLAFTTDATRRSDVGTYAVTAGGQSSGNYAISYVGGSLEIDPAALTVSVNDADRSYGSANPAFTASYDGFVLGQDADVLDGDLVFTSDATATSPVGTYAVTAGGQTSDNYAISFVDGSLSLEAAALSVIADNAVRVTGEPNPAFTASYEGFVLGEDESALGGTLAFFTPAGPDSPAGTYTITPGGLEGGNYAITFVDGALSVQPAPVGPDGGTGAPESLTGAVDPLRRGVPPLTPGDATFRTTQYDAPPAVSNTFALTYSLGEIVQLAPTGGAAAQGFVPAAGGGEDIEAGDCSGPINRGADAAGCARQATAESFWTTTSEESN